jgi:nucleoside-diphosphate-sugar epimerase
MKILVTGGAGYKGVVLVEELLRLRHQVTLIDNFMYGYEPVLHLVSRKNLEIRQLDIRNIQEKDLAPYDVIYHLAGISGVPACAANAHSAEFINVTATRRLVKALSKGQLLVNASTTSFYGASGKIFDENTRVEPISLYGQTKYAAEQIVQQRENSVSLRFATVFGVSPRMRNDLMVNDFAHKAMTERVMVLFAGQSRRTFIHIQDAAAAYAFVLTKTKAMRGQVFNVGGESLNHSKMEIAQAIQKHVPCEIIDSSMPTIDKRNFEVSFKKIEKLGYKTKFTLDDGVRELVKLYSFYTIASQYKVI